MKVSRLLVLVIAALVIVPPPVLADCCKIPIPPCPPGGNPDPGPGTVPTDTVVQDGNADITSSDGEVPLPADMSDTEMLDEYAALGGFFREDLQQAVIGWNGTQEVLILTTNEESLVGDTAMLSVMPLPGKPVDITQADKRAFAKAKKLVLSKAEIGVGSGSLGVFMERTIGAHNIFVWEIEDQEDFPKMVQAYISRKYDGKAKALLTKETLNVINSYHKRGFRYFAFDLVTVSKTKSTKEAIAYHFNSKFLYYPMVISSAGGTGKTVAELVVFTEKEITKLSGIKRDQIKKLGNKTVGLNQTELEPIDKRLAGLFAPGSQLTGRVLLIPGKLESFREDLIAQ